MKNAFIGAVIGFVIALFVYPYLPIEHQKEVEEKTEVNYPDNFAEVKKVDGVIVFINSKPLNLEKFEMVGEFDPGLLEDAIENVIDLVKKFEFRKAKQAIRSLAFENKLDNTISNIKRRYQNQQIDAVILEDGFNLCKVYKFK